jgi:hypothetical protein
MSGRRVVGGAVTMALLLMWVMNYWLASPSRHLSAPDRTPHCRQNDRRILLMIQFPPSQWLLLKENLDTWSLPQLFPCHHGSATSVDLVLYVSRETASVLHKVEQLVSNAVWQRCFGRIMYRSYNLDPDHDIYGVGTLAMFYRSFSPTYVPDMERYHYSFLMEPDTRPIRAGWLNAMVDAASGPQFWHKGSVPRYPTDGGDVHINGNAFYRLNDPVFTAFVLRSEGAYKPYMSFDQSLHAHRTVLHAQDTAHLFVPCEFVVNNWRGFTYYTHAEVIRALPDTYLLHGKHAVKMMCAFVNCTDSVYGSMSRIGG